VLDERTERSREVSSGHRGVRLFDEAQFLARRLEVV
jgi:hypothetical protein